MPAPKNPRKWIVVGLFAAGRCWAAAGAAWVERTPLLAWYDTRGLARATEQDRALWVDRVAGLGEDGEPGVLACLGQADDGGLPQRRRRPGKMGGAMGADDARAAVLAGRMAKGSAIAAGRRRLVLEAAAAWFRPTSAGADGSAAFLLRPAGRGGGGGRRSRRPMRRR